MSYMHHLDLSDYAIENFNLARGSIRVGNRAAVSRFVKRRDDLEFRRIKYEPLAAFRNREMTT